MVTVTFVQLNPGLSCGIINQHLPVGVLHNNTIRGAGEGLPTCLMLTTSSGKCLLVR